MCSAVSRIYGTYSTNGFIGQEAVQSAIRGETKVKKKKIVFFPDLYAQHSLITYIHIHIYILSHAWNHESRSDANARCRSRRNCLFSQRGQNSYVIFKIVLLLWLFRRPEWTERRAWNRGLRRPTRPPVKPSTNRSTNRRCFDIIHRYFFPKTHSRRTNSDEYNRCSRTAFPNLFLRRTP